MSETAFDKFSQKESALAGWDDGSPAAIWWHRQPSYQYPEQRKVGPAVFVTEDGALVFDGSIHPNPDCDQCYYCIFSDSCLGAHAVPRGLPKCAIKNYMIDVKLEVK